MEIKIINKSNNPNPSYKTAGAAGMDICAFLEENLVLQPMEIKLIPTGIYLEIPKGYEVQIRARSGLSLKHGITLANGIGTIDSDYRGEVGIIAINLGSEPFTVENGDRIAQMVCVKVEKMDLVSTDEITETDRSDGGFGHSGIKS